MEELKTSLTTVTNTTTAPAVAVLTDIKTEIASEFSSHVKSFADVVKDTKNSYLDIAKRQHVAAGQGSLEKNLIVKGLAEK